MEQIFGNVAHWGPKETGTKKVIGYHVWRKKRLRRMNSNRIQACRSRGCHPLEPQILADLNQGGRYAHPKYSRLRCLLCVICFVICFYLGSSGSILQIRTNMIKLHGSKFIATYLQQWYNFEPTFIHCFCFVEKAMHVFSRFADVFLCPPPGISDVPMALGSKDILWN